MILFLIHLFFFFFLMIRRPPRSTLFPNTTLSRSCRDRRGHVLDHGCRHREVDGNRVTGEQPDGVRHVAGCDHRADLVTRLASLRLHDARHLAVAQQRQFHATLRAGSKNAWCSRHTTSRTRASSTTKVRLTREAPWEMSETLMSPTVVNTRAATPGVARRPSPTTHTIARSGSSDTVLSPCRSATMASRDPASSTVSDTLTSDVVTTSTAVRCRSNTSNNARRNPYAPSMRAAVIWRIVTPHLCAIAFTPPGRTSPPAVTSVPPSRGARELQIRTGMSRSIAGWMVLGCSTLAPKYASSAASAYDKLGTVRAPGTTRGSAVSTPLTSVQIWISRASSAAPIRAAE